MFDLAESGVLSIPKNALSDTIASIRKQNRIKSNTLALLKNRHTERTGHPIGDRLKLEPN